MFNILNEEVKIRSDKKLRDAIHDIVVTLESDEFFNIVDISNILRDEYSTFVTPKLLLRLLTLWKDDKYGVFTRDDKTWLSWDEDEEMIENNIKKRKRPSILGKSRKRIKKEEEKEKFKEIKESGWVKLRDGRFIYRGIKTFKIDKDEQIGISKYEKEEYEEGENPITPELIRNLFVLDHPNDANELSFKVKTLIDNKEIKSIPQKGNQYYFETFRKLMEIGKELKLDRKRGWEKKYAPSRLKEIIIKRKKKDAWEKEQEKESLKTTITDENKEESIKELNELIDTNKKYFILVTKYNNQKKIYYIKKILFGYISISNEKYDDGYYKVVLNLEKDNNNDIINFNTMMHFKRCLKNGLRADGGYVYNIISFENIDKLAVYVKELKKRYKGWDEFLDKETIDKLKNDF